MNLDVEGVQENIAHYIITVCALCHQQSFLSGLPQLARAQTFLAGDNRFVVIVCTLGHLLCWRFLKGAPGSNGMSSEGLHSHQKS